MLHAAPEPATSTYAAQTVTHLTKLAGDAGGEIAHSHSPIGAKTSPAGLEPETSDHAAHDITHLTIPADSARTTQRREQEQTLCDNRQEISEFRRFQNSE